VPEAMLIDRMKAAYITQPGPPESIVYGDLPMPRPGPLQCLVRVGAVSLNPVDTYVRSGGVPMPLPSPFVVGCDVAGTVIQIGEEVTEFRIGDRVWGSNQGLMGRQGTFSEYVSVEERWLYPTPKNVSDEAVAAAALVGITAHLGLLLDVKLQKGETIFVNGGGGAIGAMVIQMAKALGARVVAATSSELKMQLCLKRGADFAVNYNTVNPQSALKKILPAGVDVWWETSREPDFDRAINALAARGRMVIMAGRDARPSFPVGPFYVKGCSLHGFVMFNAQPDEQLDAAEDINRWLADGRITPHIDRVMPLAQTAAAHRLQEENTLQHTGALAGKIVLKP
jgi:NADPH:quinone reductase